MREFERVATLGGGVPSLEGFVELISCVLKAFDLRRFFTGDFLLDDESSSSSQAPPL